jgi:hypothetical protein
MELMVWQQKKTAAKEEKGAEAGGVLRAAEYVSQAGQASVGCKRAPRGDCSSLRPMSSPWTGSSYLRGRCRAPVEHKEEEGPRLRLVTALPLGVWQEHLKDMLILKEAVQLRVVCKALKVVVMGWTLTLLIQPPGRSSVESANHLERALTCFSACRGGIEDGGVLEKSRWDAQGGACILRREAAALVGRASRGPAQPHAFRLLSRGPRPQAYLSRWHAEASSDGAGGDDIVQRRAPRGVGAPASSSPPATHRPIFFRGPRCHLPPPSSRPR